MSFNKSAFVLFAAAVLQFSTHSSAAPVDLQAEEHDETFDTGNAWETSGYFEGDILLQEELFRNGKLSPNGRPARFPSKIIPYKIDSQFSDGQKTMIKGAIEEFHSMTCIRFRATSGACEDKDYIYFKPSAHGCSSYVGIKGGQQAINLHPTKPGSGCFKHGTIVHEILHALGFHHQHSSMDRDNYVTINWQNVKSGTESNFIKYSQKSSTAFGVPYDYNSIMHYSRKAFSKNGADTVIPKRSGIKIGQRSHLSAPDIKKLHLMYGC